MKLYRFTSPCTSPKSPSQCNLFNKAVHCVRSSERANLPSNFSIRKPITRPFSVKWSRNSGAMGGPSLGLGDLVKTQYAHVSWVTLGICHSKQAILATAARPSWSVSETPGLRRFISGRDSTSVRFSCQVNVISCKGSWSAVTAREPSPLRASLIFLDSMSDKLGNWEIKK